MVDAAELAYGGYAVIQMRSRWVTGSITLAGALAVISCGNEAGPDERHPLRPSFNAAPTLSTTLSPATSDQAIGPVTLGSYPNPTLAVVEVSGVLNQYYSSSPGWNFPPPTGDLRGTLKGQMDAGGEFNGSAYQCSANVAVLFTQDGGKVFCDYSNMKPLTSVWADTSVLRGDGTAR
jgi:hypothetical protein